MLKFNKHNVQIGKEKARVNYSSGSIYKDVKLGMAGGTRQCVTLYAKDTQASVLLRSFFTQYQNDSDSMTDYFEQGRVRLFPGDALYESALACCK